MSKNLEMYEVDTFKGGVMEITNVLSGDYFAIHFDIHDDILRGVNIEDNFIIFEVESEINIHGQTIFKLEFENKTYTLNKELREIK